MISNFAFTPTDGLRNAVSFPTDPTTEADARNQPQTLLDQIRDYINNQIITEINNKLGLSGGSLTGALSSNNTLTGTALIASGLPGATQASRYVGATASGAPTTGTFNKGDFVIAQDGYIWQCTTAGTPGTWSKGGNTAQVTSGSYTGDSTVNRNINLGVTPKILTVSVRGGNTNMGGSVANPTWAYAQFNLQQSPSCLTTYNFGSGGASQVVLDSILSVSTTNLRVSNATADYTGWGKWNLNGTVYDWEAIY